MINLLNTSDACPTPCQGESRIVSLIPSLTETLCDFGLQAQLVGRTRFCSHPPRLVAEIPALGGPRDVDLDALCALAPTHLLANPDENRRDQLEALEDRVPNILLIDPRQPADHFELFDKLGRIFRRPLQAATFSADLRAAQVELQHVTGHLPRERVRCLVWKDPWIGVARGTYLSAMLAAAGWDSLPEASQTDYPLLDAAREARIAVDRVLMTTDPYPFEEAHRAEVEAAFAAPALVVDGRMLCWYGTRVAAGLRYLAGLRRVGC